jgi:hypothetical protein
MVLDLRLKGRQRLIVEFLLGLLVQRLPEAQLLVFFGQKECPPV